MGRGMMIYLWTEGIGAGVVLIITAARIRGKEGEEGRGSEVKRMEDAEKGEGGHLGWREKCKRKTLYYCEGRRVCRPFPFQDSLNTRESKIMNTPENDVTGVRG